MKDESQERIRGLFLVLVIALGSMIPSVAKAQDLASASSHSWQSESAASLPGPRLFWDRPVKVYFNGREDIQRELEYALWSWSERTGLDISYGGKAVSASCGAVGVHYIIC